MATQEELDYLYNFFIARGETEADASKIASRAAVAIGLEPVSGDAIVMDGKGSIIYRGPNPFSEELS